MVRSGGRLVDRRQGPYERRGVRPRRVRLGRPSVGWTAPPATRRRTRGWPRYGRGGSGWVATRIDLPPGLTAISAIVAGGAGDVWMRGLDGEVDSMWHRAGGRWTPSEQVLFGGDPTDRSLLVMSDDGSLWTSAGYDDSPSVVADPTGRLGLDRRSRPGDLGRRTGPSTSWRAPTARCGRPRKAIGLVHIDRLRRAVPASGWSAGSRSAPMGGSTSPGRRASIAWSSDLPRGTGYDRRRGTADRDRDLPVQRHRGVDPARPIDAAPTPGRPLLQAHDDLADATVAAHGGVGRQARGRRHVRGIRLGRRRDAPRPALSRAIARARRWPRDGGTRVRLRIGIHTGDGRR